MKSDTQGILTNRITARMKQLYISKADMARRLDMDYVTFWRKVNGQRSININLLKRIAELLGTSTAYLMGETDDPVPRSEPVITPVVKVPSNKSLSLSYWGEVVDNIRELIKTENWAEISLVFPLIKSGYDMLAQVEQLRNEEIHSSSSNVVIQSNKMRDMNFGAMQTAAV